ncbi:hypothetical protein F4776DRAFT_623175 [Hypoxylon sp. NC0597]|nr:hypothetical protein F4776DRAFT_623175 [Hypoxylon sp. NC0597]
MPFSVEAVVAIVALFVATPPTILVLSTCIRRRRYFQTRQRKNVDILERLRAIRHLVAYVNHLIDDEMNNGERL